MSGHSRTVVSKIADAWRSGGVVEVGSRVLGRGRHALRRQTPSSLLQVARSDAQVFSSPIEALLALGGPWCTEPAVLDLTPFQPRALSGMEPMDTRWSAEYDLGSRSQVTLFALVSALSPSLVIETGVAAGASTAQILSALTSAEEGRLVSIDVSNDVGELVPDALKERWNLVVLPPKGRREAFSRILESYAGFQIFFHDSDHSEPWQRFEYEMAARFSAPNAVLCSDDVEASRAFLDFCSSRELRPVLVLDGHKVMGLVRLTG